jgi:predicted AAA+ superfamily ATPase
MTNPVFLLFQNIQKAKIFIDMAYIIDEWEKYPTRISIHVQKREELRSSMLSCMRELVRFAWESGAKKDLWQAYLTDLLVNDENAFSMSCEAQGSPNMRIQQLALFDMTILRFYFQYPLCDIAFALKIPEWEAIADYDGTPSLQYDESISEAITTLTQHIKEAQDDSKALDALTKFYQCAGVGMLGLHKAFRLNFGHKQSEFAKNALITPIYRIPRVTFADLVGLERQKQKLSENTLALLEGRPSNNCLLYGDAGSGKSTCIRALANLYYEKGLRIIEVYKHQFGALQDLIAQIKNRRYKFIIYMDDLSFEDFEIEYKYLKAIIEGGLEDTPNHVRIYATSNRRHLIRENYEDKVVSVSAGKRGADTLSDIRQDMHAGDTVSEKLSLAARFGLTIYFEGANQKEYQEIVRKLAERSGLTLPEDTLLSLARQWELSHGGVSGRCAEQFIDDLCGVRGAYGGENLCGN